MEMFEAFQKALDEYNRPYILLKGDKESRLKKAVEAIDAILASKTDLYSYSDSLKNE
jgi:nicotinamide riboside kinase